MKRQRRLETFFQSQRERYTYFYMDWSNESEIKEAKWLKEKPENVNWEREIMWQEMKLFITIGAYIPPTNQYSQEQLLLKEQPKIDQTFISLVKSNLQKCVRRQLTTKALKTAKRFMQWDMQQFIRRLTIIMMEDVILHKSLSTLVWLTAAQSKGFAIGEEIELWLLSIVEYLCREKRESYWSERVSNKNQDFLTVEYLKKIYEEAKKHKERDLLFSLLLRKSYGGMNGDCIMIMSFATLLSQDKCIVSFLPLKSPASIQSLNIKLLELSEIEQCSVDFHCYPQLLSILSRSNKDIKESDIKAAIWHHNSKINYRVLNGNITMEETIKTNSCRQIWDRIKYRVSNIQNDYISQCRNRLAYQMRLINL